MQNRAYTTPLSVMLCLLGILHVSSIFSQTQWIGPANGDWFTSANWNNGLPAAGKDALIGGGNSVVIGGPLTIAGFNVNSFGSISLTAALDNQGTFDSSGPFAVSGGGSVVNKGTLRNFSTMSFAGTASLTNEAGALFSNSV